MGSALPIKEKDILQSTFCRSQDFRLCFSYLFHHCHKFTAYAFCVSEVTVVGTLWACLTWDGYTLWWWDCPGTSWVHSGKCKCLLPLLFWCRGCGSTEISQPVSTYGPWGGPHYCTRGKGTRRRKCIARETSLHRTSGAAHDAHETSMKAANNSLDNYLAYQWFALRGSKRGSKGSTFYSSCAWKILLWYLA